LLEKFQQDAAEHDIIDEIKKNLKEVHAESEVILRMTIL